MAYRISCAETPEEKAKEETFTGLGLTSRKNLCIHPEVSKEKKGKVVDARCRDLTSTSACEKGRADPGSVPLCEWHEVRYMMYSLKSHSIRCNVGFERPGTWSTRSSWYLDLGRCLGVWPGPWDVSVLYRQTNGNFYLLCTLTYDSYPSLDAFRRRRYLLFPLSSRPEGCGTSVKRDLKGLHCCL
jgi:hypothetical protein